MRYEEMADLDNRISALEARVVKYETELDAATTAQEKSEIRLTIITGREILKRLMDEKNKSLPQDLNSLFGIPWNDEKFDFFGHSIGVAQLAVGVIGLGSLVAGGRFYAVKQHQRATSKFFQSLLDTSKHELSKIKYAVLPRGNMHVGIRKKPIKKLNLCSAFKSVALIGDNRSGKTIFLCSTVLNEMFPWWYRYFFPPRGIFLTGSQMSATVNDWLKGQISTTEKDNPWSAVMDLLSQRRNEQRVRVFLQCLFKTRLPAFLEPQPAIIVVDQAEELLRAYRGEFLVGFYNLVKKARDTDLLRLVLVINTENAVKALKLMNGGNMFTIIQAPKVSREAVVDFYGESFAKVFDDCDSCIGVALDYMIDEERSRDMTPKEYAAMKKEQYTKNNCLAVEISTEEFTKAGEHFVK